jgi:hypothetical protein
MSLLQTEYEFSPIGMSTEHFGTEWDWLRFFWSLWSGSPMWDVDEIAPMWGLVDDDNRASLCCSTVQPFGDPYPPDDCTKTNNGTGCSAWPIAEEIVGKLWANDTDFSVTDSVTHQVDVNYPWPSTMRTRFYNVGNSAKVDY